MTCCITNHCYLPKVDRSSPDGQERDIVPPCQPDNVGKGGGEPVESLQQRLSMMEEERKGLEAKVAQLEESLELMQGEFESMEDYWQRKLEEERVFYEEQLRSSERQFSELEARMREYEELVMDNRNMAKNEEGEEEEVEGESLSEEDKLSTIEETGSLEVEHHCCVITDENVSLSGAGDRMGGGDCLPSPAARGARAVDGGEDEGVRGGVEGEAGCRRERGEGSKVST